MERETTARIVWRLEWQSRDGCWKPYSNLDLTEAEAREQLALARKHCGQNIRLIKRTVHDEVIDEPAALPPRGA